MNLCRLSWWLSVVILSFVLSEIIHDDEQNDGDSNIQDFIILPNNSAKAIKEAEYAVKELSKLSDSGIYESLKLKSIIQCSENDGIFHYNTLLTLELESPYFKSGKAYEVFKMIVMLHKEDKVKALAIDEFPVMDEDVIEEYYIRKIERKRKEREESFRRLEIEAYLDADDSRDDTNSKPRFVIDDTFSSDALESNGGRTIQELLLALDTQDMQKRRVKDSEDNIQHRLSKEKQLLMEEQQLVRFSLKELYEIVTEQIEATDYQRFRARSLLDVAMSSLPDNNR